MFICFFSSYLYFSCVSFVHSLPNNERLELKQCRSLALRMPIAQNSASSLSLSKAVGVTPAVVLWACLSFRESSVMLVHEAQGGKQCFFLQGRLSMTLRVVPDLITICLGVTEYLDKRCCFLLNRFVCWLQSFRLRIFPYNSALIWSTNWRHWHRDWAKFFLPYFFSFMSWKLLWALIF